MNEIVIKETKEKALELSVLSVIMVLASIFNLYIGIIDGVTIYIIIGIIGTLFFGYAMVYIIGSAIRTWSKNNDDFLIKINDEGITDFSSKVSTGLIRWEEIKSAKITRVFTQKFVSLELVDEEEFFSRLPKNAQRFQKINKRMKYSPINLKVQTAKISPEELLKIIDDRLNRYVSS